MANRKKKFNQYITVLFELVIDYTLTTTITYYDYYYEYWYYYYCYYYYYIDK